MKPIPENILRAMPKEDRQRMGKDWRTWNEIQSDNMARDERTLQKQIAALLSLSDVWYSRSRMDKRTTNKRGTPDFLFVWNGRPYAFEAKIGKAEPTNEQLDCHSQMRRNGWLVFVVRSIEDVRAFLDGKPHKL